MKLINSFLGMNDKQSLMFAVTEDRAESEQAEEETSDLAPSMYDLSSVITITIELTILLACFARIGRWQRTLPLRRTCSIASRRSCPYCVPST